MSYKLVKGHFHLYYRSEFRFVGARPDGDSMWFRPDNQDNLTGFGGRSVDYNGGGFAQLRFEGVDALELHYRGSHQKVPECVTARDRLLRLAGFKEVTYTLSEVTDIDTSVRTASPHPTEGYILSRSVDPYGRPVAFAFAGRTNESDGSDVFLDTRMLSRSLNAKLAGEGLAYPAYYTRLPYDLRDSLTDIKKAKRQGRGIWQVDRSLYGTRIIDAPDIETVALWPKLFRRLFSYYADGGAGIDGFEAWLRDSGKDDELWIISRGEFGNLHDVVEVAAGTIKMINTPEDIVIVPG